jgi:hypothetical protein
MPYQGSKNKLAKDIIEQMPPAEHFYDLFGGGGAISHCAVLSGKYKYVHYNEIDPLVFKGVKMAVNGEFENENRWISRDDFEKLKGIDPYVAICFSFGNDLKTYCYSKDKERFKRAVHNFLFFNNKTEIEQFVPIDDCVFSSDDLHIKRLEFQRFLKPYINKIKNYCNCDSDNPRNILQSLEGLERLYAIKGLKDISCTNQSYDEVDIKPNSVVYCDIPYKNTKKYCHNEFDYDKFYEWCKGKKNLFVSEYSMPPEFVEVWSKKHKSFMSATKVADSVEKLFTLKE